MRYLINLLIAGVKMLKKAVEDILKGIGIKDYRISAKQIWKGRVPEEENFDVFLRKRKQEKHLLYIKVYYGGKPNYSPWVEFFGIDTSFFDSVFEDFLLNYLSGEIPPRGKIFIEYDGDIETEKGLMRNFPPAVTRLGYKLFNVGFTWFKDWYFAEGGKEGGQKLGGEKPLDDRMRSRQLREIHSDIKAFLATAEISGKDEYVNRARKRAEDILK